MSESPTDLKYTQDHEWIRVEEDVATFGITAHAAESLSDLVYIDLPKVGQAVTAGTSMGEVESVKAVSDLHCPVDGEIVEVNESLENNLGTINSDPYGQGWMVKIKLSGNAPDSLMDAADYDKIVAETA